MGQPAFRVETVAVDRAPTLEGRLNQRAAQGWLAMAILPVPLTLPGSVHIVYRRVPPGGTDGSPEATGGPPPEPDQE